ncbi:hypothetical protein B0H13DRAFT_2662249 [Mycena leptocephala]|nr:hypothetical protein B0H13DRAFT_2662249 [Mycena leptocephala]
MPPAPVEVIHANQMSLEKAHARVALTSAKHSGGSRHGGHVFAPNHRRLSAKRRADTDTDTSPAPAATPAAPPPSAIDTPWVSQSPTAMATHVMPSAIAVQIFTGLRDVTPRLAVDVHAPLVDADVVTDVAADKDAVAVNADVQIAGVDVKLGVALGSVASSSSSASSSVASSPVSSSSSSSMSAFASQSARLPNSSPSPSPRTSVSQSQSASQSQSQS